MNLGNLAVFDWETSGELPEYALQPWRIPKGKAWGTSLAWLRHADGKPLVQGGVLDDETTDPQYRACRAKAMAQVMLEEAIEHKLTLGGWNTVFDASILIAYGLGDLVNQCRFVDGLLLWRHFFIEPEYETDRAKKRPYGLKTFVAENLPQFAGYDDEVDFHDRSVEARAKLHKYNVRDCIATYAGIRLLWDALTPQQQVAAAIEAQTIPMAAAANVMGLPVDVLATKELQSSLHNDAAKCLRTLSADAATMAVVARHKDLAKFGPDKVVEKIVRSPDQLGKLLFDTWGLPVLKENTGKKTKVVTRATDKEVLHELAFKDPRAKVLHHYREALGNCTKFADNILKSADYNEDGRVHPTANIFGTYSSRLTYASQQGKGVAARPIGFAIHQEKRGKLFRAALIPPEGHDLLEFDAAGQEFRWMAIQSGDETMLQLCRPGEDPHSYMGAEINGCDYRGLIDEVRLGHYNAELIRKFGKLANLCVAEGTQILTDRGPCNIEHVRLDDLVWDGEEFARHDGLSFSGIRVVITHQGVTATPDHRVKVTGGWSRLDKAQRLAWPIDRACQAGSAFRIVVGLARRAVHEIRRDLCAGAVRLRDRARGQSSLHGDRPIGAMQGVCDTSEAQAGWEPDRQGCCRRPAAEARQRLVPEMREPQGQIVSQLRRAWDQVLLLLGVGGRGVHQGGVATSDISEAGHRPARQQWSLRAWKLALGYAKSEPRQPTTTRTYDIVNCGPRRQFSANGRIVHNSLQYRTSAPRLRVKARVDYDIPMEMPQAYHIWKVYRGAYSGVPKYWERQIAKGKRLGYAETLAGRRVKVEGNWAGSDAWSMEGTMINYPIQGTGGEQKYLAMAVLKSYLQAERIQFAWDLHDGLYFYCPKAKTAKAVPTIKAMLDNLPYKQAWNFIPPIPLPFDAKVGGSWAELKEWRE